MLFFNGLFEPLRREIALQPPSCFGCLQYASSTASSVLPPRDSILSPEAQSASPNVLCCRASTSSPALPSPSLLGESRLLSFFLSLCSLNTSYPALWMASLKGTWSLLPRTLCFPARPKLFPPPPPPSPLSSLLSNPNRLVTRSNYRWQTWKLIAGGRQAAAATTRR